MMINNAKPYLESCREKDEEPEISIFNFSEILAICTGKLKEDIIYDISGFNFKTIDDVSKQEGKMLVIASSDNLEIPREIQIIESIEKCEYQVKNNKQVLIVGNKSEFLNKQNVGIMANVILANCPSPLNTLKIEDHSLIEQSQININSSEWKDGKTIRRENRANKRKKLKNKKIK